ncbi:MAG: malate dehydrogenase [Nanoarchaeota archaeon]|nr:malate dehydrogenase [Nanoarchaeota archaeon]MBU1135389.1 malate dehydrogenase [Nanoarchaeota archaeon]MBU2520194.1 malate dehydrogenase [Nanoarchaeota archaeon]
MKISVIGAGNVGSTTALKLVQKNLADVVLVDIAEGVAEGKALDIQHSVAVWNGESKIKGTTGISQISGSDIVIVTAGFPRKPGMNRDELLKTNENIIKSISAEIKKHAPDSIVIVVTNPLDIMTYLALKKTGFPRERVLGMAGILDTSRFKALISEETKTNYNDIETMVLGGHNELMVPLVNQTTVSNRPLKDVLSSDKIEELLEKTRGIGKQIVEKSGSAYYAPSAAIVSMVEAIKNDTGKTLPISVHLEGEYNQNSICMGVPVSLGKDGMKKIIELNLSEKERKALNNSAKTIKENIARLKL